jgi:hypothetical protein
MSKEHESIHFHKRDEFESYSKYKAEHIYILSVTDQKPIPYLLPHKKEVI